ncbi:hypothetical protein QYE76_004195 [Lolium multiflorum]|uniref:[RNA-polymerase]-subunit kinase n=1 Tax=Lolium multiflorum TaxID=4521 RepID=A0AAD8VZJ9_LOLMU|nr:hypothetical protein QYE76_004195 [Lolium multiflorum]
MAARKRPAAFLDAGHATATQGSASCSKRSCTSIGSTDEYNEISRIGEGATASPARPWPRHGPPLPETAVRSLMWKLLSEAKMMHDRRVIHRDIKPANILVGEGGELVKICDFGLAISKSELPPYTQAGTAWYIAPEMLLGKPDYDARVDTWSLGCVMAEMLTGKTVFFCEDDDEDDDEIDDEIKEEIVQLRSIFRVLGMPDKRTWPGFRSLPLTAKALQLLPAEHKRSSLRDIFPEEKLSKEGFERLTAAKALKLTWFIAPCPTAAPKIDPSLVVPPRKKAPRIKFIPPAVQEKITFTIPVAMWNAQRV